MIDALRPILITGAARSGTSLTAGVIFKCGAWGGKMTGATPFNQKGQFENEEIRQRITKPFLRAIGADPMGQSNLPDTNNLKPVSGWQSKILSTIRGQGYTKGPWFYKGAKLCLYWPVWAAAFPEARWIIVRRDADEIAASCLRTSFMRAFNNKEGWLGWVREHERRFEAMREEGLNCLNVWPGKAVRGDFGELQRVVQWASNDLTWDGEVIRDFVTPKLWNAA